MSLDEKEDEKIVSEEHKQLILERDRLLKRRNILVLITVLVCIPSIYMKLLFGW